MIAACHFIFRHILDKIMERSPVNRRVPWPITEKAKEMAETKPMTSDPEFLKKLKKKQEAQKDTKKLADEMRRKAAQQAKTPKEPPAKEPKKPPRQAGNFAGRRMEDAKKSRGPFGTLAKQGRRDVVEYKKPGGPVTEYKKPGGAVAKVEGGSTAVTKYDSKAGGGGGKIPGIISRMGLRQSGPVGALVGMTEELNKGEKEWIADKKNRGPLMKGNTAENAPFKRGKGYASLPVKDRGKTFERGKGEAVLPKNVPTTERGVLGGSGVQGYGYGRKGNYQLGKDSKERDYYSGGGATPPKPKAKPASDKSRIAGKKADKAVRGASVASPKKVSDFALATRRGRSDEYLKAKMRPKKSLMDLFKSDKKPERKAGKPLTSTFARKNLAANQRLGKSK
jgi:hypothetical protein